MPSGQLRCAERVLNLVTTPERATAVIGDFAEHGEAGLRLWISILQVAGSMLWKAVVEQPRRMACLAAAGTLMQVVFAGPFFCCLFLLAVLAAVGAAVLGCDLSVPIDPFFWAMLLCSTAPAPWLAGRWVSRRAPGRELAPCLAMALFQALAIGLGCAVYGNRVSLINGLSGVAPSLFLLAVSEASLFAGAAWVRERPGAALTWFERFPFDLERPLSQLWRVPSSPDQQKIFDWWVLGTFLMLELVELLPTTDRALLEILRAVLAATLFQNAIFGRPFAWSSGGSRLWFGRLLFGGLGAWLAYRVCLELRGH